VTHRRPARVFPFGAAATLVAAAPISPVALTLWGTR
jgi:hypothetical protein